MSASNEKLKALQLTIDKLDKAYGKGTVMKLSDTKVDDVPAISTGSLGLDIALGIGGLPRGRVVEIYGPESSGKTTLAIHAIANVQRNGGIAAIIDAEPIPLPKTSGIGLAWLTGVYGLSPDDGLCLDLSGPLMPARDSRSGALSDEAGPQPVSPTKSVRVRTRVRYDQSRGAVCRDEGTKCRGPIASILSVRLTS